MNILPQDSNLTLIVENKCSQTAVSDMGSTTCLDDSEYSLLSVYETSENPLIRELIGTYTLDTDSTQAA